MTTHKTRPDLGSAEDQGSHQRRARWKRTLDALVVVVGIGVVVVIGIQAVIVASDSGESNTGAEPAQIRPAVTGPAETGPTVTGPVETGPPPARASAAPDVLIGSCYFGLPPGSNPGEARSRLQLTRVEGLVRVQFQVRGSPPRHEWAIRLRHHKPTIPFGFSHGDVFFIGTRVASERGDFLVRDFRPDVEGEEGYGAKAIDMQTGQVCKAKTWY